MHRQSFNAILDAKCRETIETSYPLFVIHHNHVTTIPDETIFHLCRCIFASALQKLPVQNQSAIDLLCLRNMLSAVFNEDHRAFVLDEPDPRLLATMDAGAKACIFAQAVAGLVYLLRKVATCSATLSPEVLDAKLARFAAGDERRAMLDAIEKSPVWSNCFEKAHIGNMIMDAIKGQAVAGADVVSAAADRKRATEVSVVEVSTRQDVAEKQLWDDGPHLQRSFGVPDVFQIMVLN